MAVSSAIAWGRACSILRFHSSTNISRVQCFRYSCNPATDFSDKSVPKEAGLAGWKGRYEPSLSGTIASPSWTFVLIRFNNLWKRFLTFWLSSNCASCLSNSWAKSIHSCNAQWRVSMRGFLAVLLSFAINISIHLSIPACPNLMLISPARPLRFFSSRRSGGNVT